MTALAIVLAAELSAMLTAAILIATGRLRVTVSAGQRQPRKTGERA